MGYDIKDFLKEFPDSDACLKYLFEKKYKRGCQCGGKYYRVKKRKCYSCGRCGNQVSPLKGTIFEKTKIPLFKWFYAIFLFSKVKNGVSALELSRHLGVSEEAGLRMGRKIRELMKQRKKVLDGVVEADETYFRKNGGNATTSQGQSVVLGMVERKGNVQAKVIPRKRKKIIKPILLRWINRGSSLATDDSTLYEGLEHRFNHNTVNHSKFEYVRGDVHTNTIEGFWSHLKRGIRGTYHGVSPKYLQSYVDSFVFSWNHRNESSFSALLERLHD